MSTRRAFIWLKSGSQENAARSRSGEVKDYVVVLTMVSKAKGLVWALLAFGGSVTLGDWAKLEDGRIGRVIARPQGDWLLEFPGPTRERAPASAVKGTLTDLEARSEVDAVMRKLADPDNHEAMKRLLGHLGPAAVPRLLDYLKRQDPHVRATALACLQFAWSPEAIAAVEDALEDENEQVREYARSVVALHFREAARASALERMSESGDTAIAGPALAERLMVAPNVERMRTALETGVLLQDLAPVLPRFHSPFLTEATLALAQKSAEAQTRFLLLGLLYQGAAEPAARSWATSQLQSSDEVLRDLAGEYLRWHGTVEESEALALALTGEADPHVRASIVAARAAVEVRSGVELSPSTGSDPGAAAFAATVDDLAGLLRSDSSPAMRSACLKRFGELEPWAPYHTILPTIRDQGVVSGKERPAKTGDGGFKSAAAFLAFAAGGVEDRAGRRPSELPEPPVASEFAPPVSGFFDPARKSFGLFVDPKGAAESPFAGSYHVGDDVAWERTGETVVAIAAGVVRLADTALPTWGGLVIIEHRLEDGSLFCSVYGHLGAWLAVRHGDLVSCGQKLGALGRSYTHENGGYAAHLHFGVRRGAFRLGTTSGYLSAEKFRQPEREGWEDPQAFLRTYLPAKQD